MEITIMNLVKVEEGSSFPLENIPFGIFSTQDKPTPRACTAIGDYVVDLAELEARGCFGSSSTSFGDVFSQPSLNKFAMLSRAVRVETREYIIKLLSSEDLVLLKDDELDASIFHSQASVTMHLPMHTTEFTDYSASEEHVSNCYAMTGLKFEQGNNFFSSPIGYTGRTSSLIASGTPVERPSGVYKDAQGQPAFQPTQRLDYELEMAFFVSQPVQYGRRISPDEATSDHIFGFVLLNDWSARDVQFYESVPIGPVNSKAFATTISPWVVMPEALAAGAAKPRGQKDGQIPSHLKHSTLEESTYDITCSAFLSRDGTEEVEISRSNVKDMYFTPGQLLAHRSSSGCGLVTGELIGMGTISSPSEPELNSDLSTAGCLLEMTWNGEREVKQTGDTWLRDGDTVRLEAYSTGRGGTRIGFGKVVGTVLPASV